MCGNSSFEKIRTILINLIQLHYFDDVINEFMNLKQETINCKGINLENLFFSCI